LYQGYPRPLDTIIFHLSPIVLLIPPRIRALVVVCPGKKLSMYRDMLDM